MASVIKVDTIKSTTGNTALTISEAGVITPQSQVAYPIADWPRLNVTRPSSTSNLAYNAWTEVTADWNTPAIEYGGTFSGGRFIPDVEGYYMVSVNITILATSASIWGVGVGANGSLYRNSFIRTGSTGSLSCSPTMTVPVYCNGTTTSVSLFYFLGASSGGNIPNALLEVILVQRLTA